MSNISIVGKETKLKILKGASYLADAVKRTMGPFGANTLVEKKLIITSDGLRTAREVVPTIEDEFERLGARIMLEGAVKAEEESADGTTATVTLADEILKQTSRLMGMDTIADRKSQSEILDQIEKEKEEVIAKLRKMAEHISTKEDLIKSALVSTKDEKLAKLIGEAQWQLGKDGQLIAEETAERECSVEFVNGIRFDNGFGTSIAINDQEKQALIANNVAVILTNRTFNDAEGLTPLRGEGILTQLYLTGVRDVAIIARAFSETAIRHAMEETNGGFRIYPINAPYTDQGEIMKDLVAVLGGKYVSTEVGKVEDMQLSDIGYAEKIVAKRYYATITGKINEKSKERIANRVKELKEKLKGEVSEFEKKNLNNRIAQLTTGFGIVKIGATTESRRKFLKDKADDAVGAVRGAWQEGIVTGGGLAFKKISEEMPEDSILKIPLMSIYQQIISRAPKDFKIEEWVKDPVKVLRCALHYACETAGILGTVETEVATENMPKCNCYKNKQQE